MESSDDLIEFNLNSVYKEYFPYYSL